MEEVATNVIASQMSERQPTVALTTRNKKKLLCYYTQILVGLGFGDFLTLSILAIGKARKDWWGGL